MPWIGGNSVFATELGLFEDVVSYFLWGELVGDVGGFTGWIGDEEEVDVEAEGCLYCPM